MVNELCSTRQLLNDAMLMIAENPATLFIGQNVAVDGSAMFHDFDGIPMSQRIEFPVAEELQLGASIGLALQGFLPVCVFPRMDFMLRAMDQLINHLDKLKAMSCGQFDPKIIIRTRVGSRTPLDAGPQHTQDHTQIFRAMLTNIDVYKIVSDETIIPAYTMALKSPRSVIVVESL